MSGLTDFLLARIAEDEAAAQDCKEWSDCFSCPTHERFDTRRVLAECEAKRRILEDYRALDADYRITRSRQTEARRFQALVSIGQLATAYADHPDYREEWKP